MLVTSRADAKSPNLSPLSQHCFCFLACVWEHACTQTQLIGAGLTLSYARTLHVFYFSDRLIKNDPYPLFYLICIWSRSVFMLRALLREDTPNWFCESQLLSLWGLSLPTFPLPPLLPSLLCSFHSSLLHPLLSFSPSDHFSLALHFFSGLREDLTMQPRLALGCLHSPNWPQTPSHPSASTSWVLESQVCAITSRGIISFKLLSLRFYISAHMHWHLSKQFYVGED